MNRAKVLIVLAGVLALDGRQARAQVEPAWSSVPAAGVFKGAYAGIGTLFQRQDIVLTSTRLLGGRSGAGEGWTFQLWLDGSDDRDLPSRVVPIDYCQPLFCPSCSGSNDLALCKSGSSALSSRAPEPRLLDQWWKPFLLANGESTHYGYGWSLSSYEGHWVLSHGGGSTVSPVTSSGCRRIGSW